MTVSNITLTRDRNSQIVQVLQPVPDETVQVASEGTSANVALPSGFTVFQFHGTNGAWLNFGDSSVTASSGQLLVPADIPVIFSVGENTHVAATRGPMDDNGTVYITPMR